MKAAPDIQSRPRNITGMLSCSEATGLPTANMMGLAACEWFSGSSALSREALHSWSYTFMNLKLGGRHNGISVALAAGPPSTTTIVLWYVSYRLAVLFNQLEAHTK